MTHIAATLTTLTMIALTSDCRCAQTRTVSSCLMNHGGHSYFESFALDPSLEPHRGEDPGRTLFVLKPHQLTVDWQARSPVVFASEDLARAGPRPC